MISDRPSDFRVQMRRLSVTTIKTSYKWICNHLFLLGFVVFLYLLHRTCPLLFSPLVAASPVLVCTFVLLGTILSFGEPNIPEIDTEPVHEADLYRAEVSRDDDSTVVERGDTSFTVERFENDEVSKLVESQMSEAEEDSGSFDYKPLVDETLDEIKRDTHVRFEEESFVVKESGGDRVQVSGDEQSSKYGKSLEEMMDDPKEDLVDLSPVSPWRPMRHEEDEDDDADRDDSGSDGGESSSPDASMTDIIPMLDELHPLLHIESSSRGIADVEGSDVASEDLHSSSSSSDDDDDEGMESDVESASHGEEGDNENEEEEEEEEEEKKEEKDDESKSAIKWTEVDQKNVMDLGSLELERNQRLENLIARRKARHSMRLMAERNLIDFDSADIPFNMPPISTARQNPFDLPYDSYDDMGLPPIPGSAPSIMFARRNPFDLPYEPNEEKPNLKGDGFEEEFSSQQPKDPVFRRHESFSVGPSTLGGPRYDRLRPFFVLERLANEGASYYPFERQLSEVSESKASSVPDTESVCTVLEDDEKKVNEHESDRETEISKADVASHHSEEKNHSASDHEEESHLASDNDEEKSHLNSEHEEEKSHSSEDSDLDEAEIILGNAETQHVLSNMMDGETSDTRKLDSEDSSDSDSSLSEIEEKRPDVSDNEAMLVSDHEVDLHEESHTSSHHSFEELEIDVAREVDDEGPPQDSFVIAPLSIDDHQVHIEEPVYDSSPPSCSRFPSFSSVSSDHQPDLPVKNVEEVQENADKEREVYSESISPPEIETETTIKEVGETSTRAIEEAGPLIAEVETDGKNNSTVSVPETEDALLDESSLPLDKNNVVHEEDDPLSVSSQEDTEELHVDEKEAVDTREIDVNTSHVDLVSPKEDEISSSTDVVEEHLPIEHVTTVEESPDVIVHDIAEVITHEEEEKHKEEGSSQTFNADIPIDSYSTLSSGAVEYVETNSFSHGDNVPQAEQSSPVRSSDSDTGEETNTDQTMDIEVVSETANASQNAGSEEASSSRSERELTWADKSVVEQSSAETSEDQVPPAHAAPVSVVFSRNITFHEYHDAPEDIAELSGLTSDTSSSSSPTSQAESPEYTTPMVGKGSKVEFK